MNWRPWLRTLVVIVALALGWFLRTVTVPLLAAYLLTLVWLPVQQRLKARMGGGAATALCVLFTFLLPLALFSPVLLEVDQISELFPTQTEINRTADQIYGHIQDLVAALPLPKGIAQPSEEDLQKILGRLLEGLSDLAAGMASFLGGFFGILTSLILLPIFLFFLLQGAPWLPIIRRELPAEWHARFDAVLPRVRMILQKYCTARLLVAAVKALMILAILLVAGIPAPYTLALLSGVLSLIPVLGSLVAFLLLAAMAFASQGGVGLMVAVGAYVSTEVIEGYVLLPRMVGRGLGLSDFSVILAALAGGALAGIFGLLIAVPAVAVAKVLYDEFVRPVMGTKTAPDAAPA